MLLSLGLFSAVRPDSTVHSMLNLEEKRGGEERRGEQRREGRGEVDNTGATRREAVQRITTHGRGFNEVQRGD